MSAEMILALLVATAVSGVVPLVNAELVVVAAAASLSALAVPLVALTAAIGQMTAKTALYALARWAPSRLPAKASANLEKASAGLDAHGRAIGTVLFTSASLGFPPFYGISIAAGALRVRFVSFVALGLAGRLLRFAVLAWGANEGSRAILGTAWAAVSPLGPGIGP